MSKETTDKKIDNLTQVVAKLSKTMVRGFKDAEIRTDNKIDELARITANGFSNMQNEINERFKKVDERFDKVDTRFDRIDEDFREINMKLHDRDENVRGNTTRIEKLEENVGIL